MRHTYINHTKTKFIMNSQTQNHLTAIIDSSPFIEFRVENNCEPSHHVKPDSDDDFLMAGNINCSKLEADVRVILHPKTTPADAVRSLNKIIAWIQIDSSMFHLNQFAKSCKRPNCATCKKCKMPPDI